MRIAIATVQVPFITGGAEILAQLLKEELIKRNHIVEIVTIPFKWYPPKQIVNCMMMGRLMDLSEINGERIDLVIALKFPAYYVRHDNKVMWLLHQHRQAYDLWGTEYGDLHNMKGGKEVRDFIEKCDRQYIAEFKGIYTISQNTTDRLRKYTDIESTVLYHPPINYEKLHCDEFGDFIFYASRIDSIKRQRLLVEAVRYCKTPVKVVIAGGGAEKEIDYIHRLIKKYKLENRVSMVGYISEGKKQDYYAKCLGVYFGAYDEDYGYVTLESFFSHKPIIVHKDAGGPLEFVENGKNGYVLESEAHLIAEKMDAWYSDRKLAMRMGEEGYQILSEKNINWDYVINKLLDGK